MWTQLDQYLFARALRNTLLSLGFFILVLVLGNALRSALGLWMQGILHFTDLLMLTALLVPSMLPYAMPLGLLTGTLKALSALSEGNEILAMRNAGLSLWRISRPFWLLGLIGFGISLFMSFYGSARAYTLYKEGLNKGLLDDPLRFFKAGSFVNAFPNYILFLEKEGESQSGAGDASSLSASSKREASSAHDAMQPFYGAWLWEQDEAGRLIRLVKAERLEATYLSESAALSLRLHGAEIQQYPQPGASKSPFHSEIVQSVFVQKLELDIPLTQAESKPLSIRPKKPNLMTYAELQQAIEYDPEHAIRYKMQMGRNVAMALSLFAFIAICFPFGLQMGRKEPYLNMLLALGIALGYYVVQVSISFLEVKPEWYPHYALLLEPIALLLFGLKRMRALP